MIVVFCRAWLQVFLVALNVTNISQQQYGRAFLTGTALSAAWWFNAHSAAHVTGEWAWLVYALGAGAGTVSGMWVGLHQRKRG